MSIKYDRLDKKFKQDVQLILFESLSLITVLFNYVPTFDFVGSSGTDLCFTVLQEILEGWDQVILGDLWSHCFLELHSERSKHVRIQIKL